jgi:hypothetical protein
MQPSQWSPGAPPPPLFFSLYHQMLVNIIIVNNVSKTQDLRPKIRDFFAILVPPPPHYWFEISGSATASLPFDFTHEFVYIYNVELSLHALETRCSTLFHM